MKCFDIELETTRRAHGELHTSKYTAHLRLMDDTTFEDIAVFVEDVKKIWGKAISAAKSDADGVCMEVTESAYITEPWEQKLFNRWYLRNVGDICTEKGEESVYLVPDERYTPANRDMCIGRDILKDIAYTLR